MGWMNYLLVAWCIPFGECLAKVGGMRLKMSQDISDLILVVSKEGKSSRPHQKRQILAGNCLSPFLDKIIWNQSIHLPNQGWLSLQIVSRIPRMIHGNCCSATYRSSKGAWWASNLSALGPQDGNSFHVESIQCSCSDFTWNWWEWGRIVWSMKMQCIDLCKGFNGMATW